MRSGSCVDLVRTDREVVLNASTLSDPEHSLIIPLTTEISVAEKPDFLTHVLSFPTLLDSGSTDCFIDTKFVYANLIPTITIPSINLRLFDGSLSPEPISELLFWMFGFRRAMLFL